MYNDYLYIFNRESDEMKRLIFEVIPPPIKWSNEQVEQWAERIVSFLQKVGIDTLNIPEVVDEERGRPRSIPYTRKQLVENFARIIREKDISIKTLLNKITVRMPEKELISWVERRIEEGHESLILVGGESHKIDYPGPSVLVAAENLKKRYPKIKFGGITIFTRPGEANRIYQKLDAGIDFFVSQIVFETANIKQVIFELEKLLSSRALPEIFVSLAPAAKVKDLEFMYWLGVEFPSAIYSYLIDRDLEIPTRSQNILERLAAEIYDIQHKPTLGINFEHVMYSNLDISFKIIEHIKREKIT